MPDLFEPHKLRRDDEHNDMNLPAGAFCGQCVHYPMCLNLFGCHGDSQKCDWSPSRFQKLG